MDDLGIDMKPQLVVSICGGAAVGKGTLIDGINKSQQIRERFGISGEVAFFSTRKTKKTRSEETDYAWIDEMYSPPYLDTLVHRWQLDSKNRKNDKEIERLREHFPFATHRIIVVWRDWKTHAYDRQLARYSFDQGKTFEEIEQSVRFEWTKILNLFGPESRRNLEGFEIELVNGTNRQYSTLAWEDVTLQV